MDYHLLGVQRTDSYDCMIVDTVTAGPNRLLNRSSLIQEPMAICDLGECRIDGVWSAHEENGCSHPGHRLQSIHVHPVLAACFAWGSAHMRPSVLYQATLRRKHPSLISGRKPASGLARVRVARPRQPPWATERCAEFRVSGLSAREVCPRTKIGAAVGMGDPAHYLRPGMP